MTTQQLKNKLAKLNVSTTLFEGNGYNQSLVFVINGTKFLAGFTVGVEIVEDFCTERERDAGTEERERRFFSSFSKVFQYAERGKK